MKVFISWSGEVSHQVAVALQEWLADVLPGIKSFVSSEDLRKGSRWRQSLATELIGSKYGIICLNHSNITAPWVLFEAGAISSAFEESRVCTLLLGGLKPSEVREPLAAFNHTAFEREDMRKLALSINEGAAEGGRDVVSLNRSFDKFWDDLEAKVQTALLAEGKSPAAPRRSAESMLEEVLELIRANARRDASTGSGQSPKVPSQMHDAYWAKFLEQLRILAPPLYEEVRGGQLSGIQDQKFYISFPEEYLTSPERTFGQISARAALNWAASQAVGVPTQVEIVSPMPIEWLYGVKRGVKSNPWLTNLIDNAISAEGKQDTA